MNKYLDCSFYGVALPNKATLKLFLLFAIKCPINHHMRLLYQKIVPYIFENARDIREIYLISLQLNNESSTPLI